MGKNRVQKPYVKPILGPPVELAKQDSSEEKSEGAPEEAAVPAPKKILVVKPDPPRLRYCKVTVYQSVILDLPHDPYCIRAGKCFCENTAKGRIGKTLHLIAGIPQIIPQVWATHALLVGMQRSGKAVIKVL